MLNSEEFICYHPRKEDRTVITLAEPRGNSTDKSIWFTDWNIEGLLKWITPSRPTSLYLEQLYLILVS